MTDDPDPREADVEETSPPPGPGLSASWIVKQIVARAILPRHFLAARRRRKGSGASPTPSRGGAELHLYSKMLPGDFLHYGYFDDPDTPSGSVSFDSLYKAQLRYAEELAQLIPNKATRILDVGSGMGGLLGLLTANGYQATGLTPDPGQAEYIRATYPGLPVLKCRFEELPSKDSQPPFDTVIHAESLQYQEPTQVFSVLDQILAPGGCWIVADYFRLCDDRRDRSGWLLNDFRERVVAAGLRILHERDITPNVLPTLRFANELASRIALPAFDFGGEKLRIKKPRLHYILENVIGRIRQALVANMAVLDASAFAARKRYLMMVLERE